MVVNYNLENINVLKFLGPERFYCQNAKTKQYETNKQKHVGTKSQRLK